MVRVLAAVINRADTYLVGCRPTHKRHGGRWEFPGGKFEPGETPLQAAIRELREELRVDVAAIGDLRFRHVEEGAPFAIEFYDVTITGVPVAVEHAVLAWVKREELAALDLAPSDRAFAGWLDQDATTVGKAGAYDICPDVAEA